MAITPLDKCDKNSIRSQGLPSVHKLCDNTSKLMKIDFGPEDFLTASKLSKLKKNQKSPYVLGDKLQMVSRITERKIIHKRGGDFKSSFPLASNIYKASSDEFKALKRSNKKNKKSVLTLPNEPAPMPQTCTVSDVNEGEYIERTKDEHIVPKKQVTSHKRYRTSYQYDYYDRDARHIDLDCSSTELFKRYDGDGRKINGKVRKSNNKEEFKSNDVWTVLRNINRFQFRPSPKISEESLVVKKKKGKKRVNCKDRRLISETRRTEEIAYIADIEVSSKSPSSSVDRVTVIVNSDSKKQIQNDNKLSNLLYRSLTTRQKINNRTNEYLQNKNNIFPSIKDKINYSNEKAGNSHNLNTFRNSECSVKVSIDSSNHRSLINQIINGEKVSKNSDKEIPQNPFVARNSGLTRGKDAPTWKSNNNTQNNVASGIQKSNQNAALNPSRSNRKLRLVTTMPSEIPALKITSADIKRRLSHIRYPIVILGKEQYSSTMEVIDEYPNQFEGLDKRIWPFMLEWNKEHKPKKSLCKKPDDKSVKKHESIPSKLKNGRSIKEIFINKRKVDTKAAQPSYVKEEPSSLSKKMLNLIFKKSKYDLTVTNEDKAVEGYIQIENNCNANVNSIRVTQVDASTETDRSFNKTERRLKKTKTNAQPLCSKERWSSEYVDNVISKITNGSYYSLDTRRGKARARLETAVPTPNLPSNGMDLEPNTLERNTLLDSHNVMNDNSVQPIPWFDDPLPAVEVKTLNFKQLSIKHSMKNVVLQFDISVPEKNDVVNGLKDLVNSSPQFEILANGQTKVFKYKTTIVNAILPAEICSVLPEIMRNFIDTNAYLTALCTIKPSEKNPPILPAISKSALVEPIPTYRPQILPIRISPALRQVESGMFSVIKRKNISNTLLIKSVNSVSEISTNGLVKKCNVMPLFTYICDPIHFMLPIEAIAPQCQKKTQSICMALLLHYTSTHGKITPAYKRLNFFDIFKNMITCCSILIKYTTNITPLNKELYFTCEMKDTVVSVVSSDTEINKKTMTVTLCKVKVDSLFNGFLKKCADNDDKLNQLESSSKIFNVCERMKRNLRIQTNNKMKRIGFVKLYKRCKSTSNISGEKSSTLLSKIFNLDDFFQAFGSGKLLSSVFDGCAERKLMSSIAEMRSWISEITPRQALLIMLLTNKKDTPNLTRFRPILLQGIAVNRITRASELDMEIEVIERENFNKLSQTNAIPYLPAAVVNHDNLFEEMCWIAKTTASDYQKPFDESSERLLKSLLEKRKKLNPSYLRVMARYVGLGLLKSTGDKKKN